MDYLTIKLINKNDDSCVNYFINRDYTPDKAVEIFNYGKAKIREDLLANQRNLKDYKAVPEVKSYKTISKEGIENYKFIEPSRLGHGACLPVFTDSLQDAARF